MSLAISLAATTAARSENWPEFRGPTGQGHSGEKDLPVEWSPTKNVVWKKELPGKGWSSPVYVDGRIYLTTSVAEGDDPRRNAGPQSLRALAIDAKSGEITWEKELFANVTAKIHEKNSHASPTPIVAGKHIFIHFGTNGTACLDRTGEFVWKNDTIKYPPLHGSGGSPALVGERLIFSCDGSSDPFVIGLDRATGEEKWRTARPKGAVRSFSFSTPLAIEVVGKTQVVLPGSDYVVSYNPKNGKEIWRVFYEGGYSVVPRPVYGHGLVYISTGYRAPILLAIQPDGKGDVTSTHVAWQTNKGVSHNPSFLLVGDEIYVISDKGIASCFDAKTGERHWRQRLESSFSASPIYADGKIYFHSEDGKGFIVAPGKTYREIARNDLGEYEYSLASHAVADGSLFIRTREHLYRIAKK